MKLNYQTKVTKRCKSTNRKMEIRKVKLKRGTCLTIELA